MKTIPFDKAIIFVVLLFSIILASPSLAENTDNSPIIWLVFLHNDNEYFLPFFRIKKDVEIVPAKLRSNIQFGDSIGYRRYEGENIVEEVTGSITKSKKVILSNGVEFSVNNMTIFEALRKLQSIYWMLHSPSYGHYFKTSGDPKSLQQKIKNLKIHPSKIKWSPEIIIVPPSETNNNN
jgi:hypothetical protein